MSSEWYHSTTEKINELKRVLLPRDAKEYRLDKLQSIARRIDEFAQSDAVCLSYQTEIDQMIAELPGAPLPYARNKSYICTIGVMVSHLKKVHHLVNEGEYLGLALVAGLMLGMLVGIIIGNAPPATIIGLAIGLAVGFVLDARAKKAGRVI